MKLGKSPHGFCRLKSYLTKLLELFASTKYYINVVILYMWPFKGPYQQAKKSKLPWAWDGTRDTCFFRWLKDKQQSISQERGIINRILVLGGRLLNKSADTGWYICWWYWIIRGCANENQLQKPHSTERPDDKMGAEIQCHGKLKRRGKSNSKPLTSTEAEWGGVGIDVILELWQIGPQKWQKTHCPVGRKKKKNSFPLQVTNWMLGIVRKWERIKQIPSFHMCKMPSGELCPVSRLLSHQESCWQTGVSLLAPSECLGKWSTWNMKRGGWNWVCSA